MNRRKMRVGRMGRAEPDFEQPVGGEPDSTDEVSNDDAGIDWGDLTAGIEEEIYEDDVSEPVEIAPEPPPAEDTEVETPVEPEPAQAEAPPPEPETPPVEEAPVAEVPQVEAPETPEPVVEPPAPPALDPALQQQQMDAYVQQVAQGYQMSDEDQQNLISNPNSVLPNLAAQLEVNVLQKAVATVTEVLREALPTYLHSYMETRDTTSKQQNAFFDKWPELKEHQGRVMELGRVYRQINPSVTAEKFITDVGMQSWMAVGLPTHLLASRLSPDETPAPTTEQVVPAVAPSGFNPAPPSTPAQAPSVSSNPFTALTDEFMIDEDF